MYQRVAQAVREHISDHWGAGGADAAPPLRQVIMAVFSAQLGIERVQGGLD